MKLTHLTLTVSFLCSLLSQILVFSFRMFPDARKPLMIASVLMLLALVMMWKYYILKQGWGTKSWQSLTLLNGTAIGLLLGVVATLWQ